MPFDFNSGKTPNRSGSNYRWDTDYASNTGSIPRPPVSPTLNTPQPSPHSTGGFQNKPERKSGAEHEPVPFPQAPVGYTPARNTLKRPKTHRNVHNGASVPWKIVLPIIGILVIVCFCWIFNEPISEFLAQLFARIIVLFVIVFLIKWFIFGGRRR